MARITHDEQGGFGTDYLLRNVRIKMRFSSLIERITWDTIKGALQRRPGRERQQQKTVQDLPVMEMLVPEYEARLADAAKVLLHGWELATLPPPEAWMGDLIFYRQTADLHFSAKVRSNGVASTCGFLVDISPSFASAVNVSAYTSPVSSADDERIAGNMDVTGLEGLNLYVLPWINDGTKVSYGIIKHIELPASFV